MEAVAKVQDGQYLMRSKSSKRFALPPGGRSSVLRYWAKVALDTVLHMAEVEKPAEYTMLHFSQMNPEGPDQGDVPALLRRVADSIAALGTAEVQDIVFHTSLDDEAEWRPSLTVYYKRPGDNG